MLPIGMTSEEALESRNKDNKQFRLHHARKDSRSHTTEDQFHYLFITSYENPIHEIQLFQQ